MSKQKVTMKTSMFGFLEGEQYVASKTTGGWKVLNDEGDWIMMPPAAVEASPAPAAATLAAEAPAPRKKRKRPQKAVEVSVSELEAQALDEALAAPDKKPSENGKGSILGAILAGATLAGEEAEPAFTPLTPAALVQAGMDDELKRKRMRLKGPDSPLLREGQCWLTDLTEGTLPDSGVDHIITAYPRGFWPEALQKDIKEFDIYHEWDPNVLEDIHLGHVDNEKGIFVGYPGTGKTTSHQNYSALIQQPFMRLNGKDGIDASSFIGFLWASTSGTEFAEGLLPVAMRNGYYMVIDEIFKIPPDIQMNFQTVYEDDGFLLLDEKPGTLADKLVVPHPEFRLHGTDNAKGLGDDFEKFGATQNQDGSTLDRFGICCSVPYLSHDKEVQTLMRLNPDIEAETIDRLVRVANLVREGYSKNEMSLTLSMRGLKVMCKFIRRGLSEYTVYRKVYHSKLADPSEINTSETYADTVGLSKELPVKSPAQAKKMTTKAYVGGVPVETPEGAPMPWETNDTPF